MEFGCEESIFTGSKQQICTIELLVEECLQSLYVIGDLAEQWAFGVVAIDY